MSAVVFEHRHYGSLLVTNMLDIDDEETDDIELAVRAVCSLPNGEWLATCTCLHCGTLREVKSGMQ